LMQLLNSVSFENSLLLLQFGIKSADKK